MNELIANPPLSRKDVARLINCHPITIARREKELGLDKLRIRRSSRVILYPAAAARRQLRAIGYEL